jgi:hypothetical protein
MLSYENNARFRNMNVRKIYKYKIQKIIVYNSVATLKKAEITVSIMKVPSNFSIIIGVHVRKATDPIITSRIKIPSNNNTL